MCFTAAPAIAEVIEGRVIGVADGDTLIILDSGKAQRRIRIGAIDAPEKGQAWANRSRRGLAQMIAGTDVIADCHKIDRYKRHVCKVWTAPADCPTCTKTLDVGLAQIAAGLAWYYKAYENEQPTDDRLRYAVAEKEARARRIGLWLDVNAAPPWEWRRK